MDNRREELASAIHDVYMKEANRKGDVRHKDKYEDLPENIKEFDRVLADFILSDRLRILDLVERPFKGMKIDHNSALRAIDKALSAIKKARGE